MVSGSLESEIDEEEVITDEVEEKSLPKFKKNLSTVDRGRREGTKRGLDFEVTGPYKQAETDKHAEKQKRWVIYKVINVYRLKMQIL